MVLPPACGLTEEQVAALQVPPSPDAIKQRQQGGGGRSVDYLEVHHVIRMANKVFGPTGWTRATVDMRCVYEGPHRTSQRMGWLVAYLAHVTVSVYAGHQWIHTDGWGYGEGIAYAKGATPNKGRAHEAAVKEAESDATKRALVKFGDPFGLGFSGHDGQRATTVTDGEMSEGQHVCPQCGSALVVRQGRRGAFRGCSGYPQCRYTEDIAEPPPPVQPEYPAEWQFGEDEDPFGESAPESAPKSAPEKGEVSRLKVDGQEEPWERIADKDSFMAAIIALGLQDEAEIKARYRAACDWLWGGVPRISTLRAEHWKDLYFTIAETLAYEAARTASSVAEEEDDAN